MKAFKRNAGSLLIAGLATISPARAEEAVSLEPLDVWGTEIKSSSVYMGEDTMAIKQADHVSDLLRSIPGVDVGGAHSLNQRITIRSMDDKDLRITIDGANQNTYMYHHMGNLQIHADILQSVDIDIGTNSVINGGLGGAVRFETKDALQLLRPGEQYGGRVQASYADNASQGFSLTGYGQVTDNFDFLAYYNAVERDNYEVGGGEIKDENGDVIENTDGTVRGLKGEVDDALLKFGWNLAENQRIELAYEDYNDEGDYSYRPDMGLATDLAIADFFGLPLTYPTEFTRDTLTMNYELDWGHANSLKATLFNNLSTLTRDESALSSGIIKGEATNSGVNILATSELGGGFAQTLTYGLEAIRYDTLYQGDLGRSEEDATNQAVYIQDRIQLSSSMAVIPGVRYNLYDLDSAVVDDTFDETTAALAVEYQASSKLLLSASSTQLFKGPEIGEVFFGAGIDDTAN
ncbi:MAG: TonB-dependent receptor domain-containing protein, partial [Gammaproteobacteria bacterium]